MRMFYILSLNGKGQSNTESLLWWKPDDSGYTLSLDKAGQYTEEKVKANPSYYDNKKSTVAIPVEVADGMAHRVVSSDLLAKVLALHDLDTTDKKPPQSVKGNQ